MTTSKGKKKDTTVDVETLLLFWKTGLFVKWLASHPQNPFLMGNFLEVSKEYSKCIL